LVSGRAREKQIVSFPSMSPGQAINEKMLRQLTKGKKTKNKA
jgi:hypothetical protein